MLHTDDGLSPRDPRLELWRRELEGKIKMKFWNTVVDALFLIGTLYLGYRIRLLTGHWEVAVVAFVVIGFLYDIRSELRKLNARQK